MKKFKNFYESWWFLCEHPVFNDEDYFYNFQDCLDIDIQKVNPNTNKIDENKELNIHTQVWLECGGFEYDKNFECLMSCHDIRLDCGGDTFEEAIIKLANLVKKYYGKEKKK